MWQEIGGKKPNMVELLSNPETAKHVAILVLKTRVLQQFRQVDADAKQTNLGALGLESRIGRDARPSPQPNFDCRPRSTGEMLTDLLEKAVPIFQ